MSEPVLSAEYAASLVQRARDAATFFVEGGHLFNRAIGVHWYSDGCTCVCCFPDRGHWVAWYRATRSAQHMTASVLNSWANDFDRVELPVRKAWEQAAYELFDVYSRFRDNVDALGSLCQLPEDWTDAHREAARVIGGG